MTDTNSDETTGGDLNPLVVTAEQQQTPIDQLLPHPDNPRRGDVSAIVASIRANGFYGAVVVQRSTNYILAGNHRWRAAKELGMQVIPVFWVDVDDDRAKRILLADNKTSDAATYDLKALSALLSVADELEGTGYSDDDYDALMAELADLEEAPRPAADNALASENSGRTAPLGIREVRLVMSSDQGIRFTELVESQRQQGETTSATVLRVLTEFNARK